MTNTPRPEDSAMQVTIIMDSDDNAIVHRAGCLDITRRETRKRSHISHWNANVATAREAAIDAWSDFVSEGSMTEDQAVDYTTVMPCCKFPEAARS
jgi:hypothetical protein